jgi:acetate kinase
MADHLLTLNAGSSSLKVALFDAVAGDDLPSAVWSAQADGLGAGSTARLRVHDASGETLHEAALAGDQASHEGALAALLEWRSRQADAGPVVGIGHRIVHGGTRFTQPVRIDEPTLAQLTALEPLAPLHQPHNLAGVRAAMAAFAGVLQVGCFDTAFHAAQPDVNRRFAIPRQLHEDGVQRYGFHGLSYESIVAQLGALDARCAAGKVVIAHLGNGASLCAIDAGRSVATTMSFSPLDGLTMGTRCGRFDAAAVLYLMQAKGMSADRITTLLFRESGLLGLSGVSSDMRELEASSVPAAAEAIAHFVEQVVQQIGTMAAALRGLDAIVFTGGIGENSSAVRQRVMAGLAWLGVRAESSRELGPRLTADASRVTAWVLQTDEEAAIARHMVALLRDSAPSPPGRGPG